MFDRIFQWLRFTPPTDPAGHIYYVRLRAQGATFYKLGYTSMPTLRARMTYGGHGDEKLIEKELLFCFRSDAYDVEQHLLHRLSKYLAFKKYSNDPSSPLPGRGQTELFKHDVLGLDEELYKALPTEQLAKATQAFNDQKTGCLVILVGLVLAPFTLGFSLLLIFLGWSTFWDPSSSADKKASSMLNAGARPRHPADLEHLISELKKGCSLGNPVAPAMRDGRQVPAEQRRPA